MVSSNLRSGMTTFRNGRRSLRSRATVLFLSGEGRVRVRASVLQTHDYRPDHGGPIKRDKVFYFLNYERQEYVLSQGTSSQTEPSAAYVNRALALLALGGVTPASNSAIASWRSGCGGRGTDTPVAIELDPVELEAVVQEVFEVLPHAGVPVADENFATLCHR